MAIILGLMSGTSLDGLDMALCQFNKTDDLVNFEIIATKTIPYNNFWKTTLATIHNASAETYFNTHATYGKFIATCINSFLAEHNTKPTYIASHGHTVFHQPSVGFTTQIGCGATIAACTRINTICDFRSLDVAFGGQGAPLVPIGDRDLFKNYESCLNIGGIANISFFHNGQTKAFDIGVANMALNYLTEQELKKPYDDEGRIASSGKINQGLLQHFLALNSEKLSLGREWFERHILPLLSDNLSIADKLCTIVEYIAITIGKCLNQYQLNSVLITGGGAYNTYLINRIKHHYSKIVHIPAKQIIEFKEAIIFAYLGYLRVNNTINTLSSVTGSDRNSVGGCVYIAN